MARTKINLKALTHKERRSVNRSVCVWGGVFQSQNWKLGQTLKTFSLILVSWFKSPPPPTPNGFLFAFSHCKQKFQVFVRVLAIWTGKKVWRKGVNSLPFHCIRVSIPMGRSIFLVLMIYRSTQDSIKESLSLNSFFLCSDLSKPWFLGLSETTPDQIFRA